MKTLHDDAKLIDALGGPAELARALGYDPANGGTQRVQNWKYRGIPELLRLKKPEAFMPPADQEEASNAA